MFKKFLKTSFLKSLVLVAGIATLNTVSAQQLAFPGAEGFGRFTTGGRGGEVYHVTNHNDSGAGSLRDAVSKSNRTVVFDIGGVFNIKDRLVIQRNITLAGQTAPGGGVTIYGNGVALNSSSGNSIIRHVRIRMGQNGDSRKDALGISDGQNYIFDNVSISWGWDGTVDVNGTNIDNITFQDCIVGQGIDIVGHSTGGLVQSGKWSVIRSLYIDNETRNPKGKGTHEVINSVIYNWGSNGYIMGATDGLSEVNCVGNWFIYGPNSSSDSHITRTTSSFHVYAKDNWVDDNKNGKLDATALTDYKTATLMSTPFDYDGMNNVKPANEALEYVIANVGASKPRDAVDELLIDELTSYGTKGAIIVRESDNNIPNNVGIVATGTPVTDTDRDGMPDTWEIARGLNPSVADNNGDDDNDGYTNIEEYINEVADYINSPTNFVAEAVADNQVDLTWQYTNSEGMGFYLYYSENGGEFKKFARVDPNVNTYSHTKLSASTKYVYKIYAYTSSEQSALVQSNSVVTPSLDGTPFPAEYLTPENNSEKLAPESIKLTWEGADLAESFNVYFGTHTDSLELIAYQISEKSFNLPELEENASYYWRVDAVNSKGITAGSVWNLSTRALLVPEMVAYYPLDETTGTNAVDQSEFTNNGTVTNITANWVAGKVNNAIDLTAGTTTTSVVVNSQPQIEFNKQSFTVSYWAKATAGTTGYLFNKGNFSKNTSTGVGGKWYGMESKGESLYFSVDDDATKSQLSTSNAAFFTGEWVHIVAIRDIETNKLKLYLNGDLVTTQTDGTGEIGNEETLHIGNCTKNDTNFPGLIDEFRMYNYALSESDIKSLFETGTNAPEKAVTVSPENSSKLLDAKDLTFTWNKVADADSYNLFYGNSISNLSLIASNITDTFFVSNLTDNSYYYWHVDAVNSNGSTLGDISMFSTNYSVELPSAVNSDIIVDDMTLVVYPNPVTADATIKFSIAKEGNSSIAIYNLNGKLIKELANGYFSVDSYEVNLNANTLNKGIYLIVLKSEAGVSVEKVSILN